MKLLFAGLTTVVPLSGYAQYQAANGANNGRDTVTDAALERERSKQVEIGHKMVLTFDNVVTIGKARSRGLEWDVSGQLTRRLSLIGSYAYTTTQLTEDPMYQGKKLANVGPHTASLWARYAIDSQWTAATGASAQGQRKGDAGNTFQMSEYGWGMRWWHTSLASAAPRHRCSSISTILQQKVLHRYSPVGGLRQAC